MWGEIMPAKVIVGANWGDEGKGKVTDVLAATSDVVARFQGGANAGHTIINDFGCFALHTLPSGIFYPHVTNILGSGVALDVKKLCCELKNIIDHGVQHPKLIISERAQVLMPYHTLQDTYEEERLAGRAFGSTKSGIAPFYSDVYTKTGIMVADLYNKKRLKSKLDDALEVKNFIFENLYHKPTLNSCDLFDELCEYGKLIEPYVGDTIKVTHQALKENKTMLLEGQLGALKDPLLGICPFTTSSHTLAGFSTVGACVPPTEIKEIICVTKAYSSCVGSKEEPFVCELIGEDGDELRARGGHKGEFGATTGRPRRVGWFDAVAAKYGCTVQGATSVCLTCLDVLSYLEDIKIVTEYEIDGKVVDSFPVPAKLEKAKPVFTTLRGWKTDIKGIKEWEKLPENAKKYVDFIEQKIDCKVNMISTGPARKDIIYK